MVVKKSFLVGIEVTGSGTEYVILRNLTKGTWKEAKLKVGKTTMNLAELSTDGTDAGIKTAFATGDYCVAEASGNNYVSAGTASFTVGAVKGTTLILTGTANSSSNCPGVTI